MTLHRPTRVLLASTLALAAACAPAPQPRSTVQAGAIAREDLSGVWYFRQTVTGVPFSTGFTFIGEQGENEMEKIVWDIQENVLIARRAYEFVKGTEKGEPHLTRVDGSYYGAPVAAFRVSSHFDVIREYNPATGEEYDRVIESQERHWYERRFLRVDWSENLITNFNFLADYSTGSVSAIRQDPVPYYVSDPADADALRIERPALDAPAEYLEVTQKLVASPEMITFEDGTSWPLCFLEYATTDCASQEVKIRNAFLKVKPRDYEPWAYADTDMEKFGFFTTARLTYNRQYGLTDSGRVRLINRHNQWQRSLSSTACQRDADCGAAEPGVRCVTEIAEATLDVGSGRLTGVCSLPYTRRNLADATNPGSADLGPRPIVYHLNAGFPEDLKDTARELERQYDVIFRGIVTQLTGRAPASNAFVLCVNNPVRPGDPSACGAPGTYARIGDLRFNLLYWVDEPTSAGLLGYGPSSNDPETGETVAATAFVYGAQIDTYATFGRDLVRLVNGELPPADFAAGEDVRAWVQATQAGPRRKGLSAAEVAELTGRMDTSWMRGLPKTPSMTKGPVRTRHAMQVDRAKALSRSPVLGAEAGLATRRLSRLSGTGIEAKLASGEVLLAAGKNPRAPGLSVDPASVKPLALFNPERHRLMRKERRRLSAHGVDFATGLDDSVIGFALAQKGKDPHEVWKQIRKLVFLSTALHEVGHSVGLRHNFAGSFDAMNYPKTYWDLRTANGTKQPRPRHVEPETQGELEGVTLPGGLRAGISEFMQSSIMDYGAGFNSDIQGLGKYDAAALQFGYGQLLEVFNTVRDPYLVGALQATATYGEALPVLVDCPGNDYIGAHYSKLPQWVDLESRTLVPARDTRRQIVSPQCAYPDQVQVDAQQRLVVPYKFCSDEFEGASTGCEAYDRGADPFEVATSVFDRYRGHYVLDAFRRQRLGFTPEEYPYHVASRYFAPLRSMMQFYVLNRAFYISEIPDDGTPGNFWQSENGYGPYSVAVTQGFDFLGEVLLTPEPGPYQRYADLDGREAWYLDPYDPAPGFSLPLGVGRYFNTEWNFDSGYYWYEQVRHVGSFMDKVMAVAEMTDPETYFIGKDVAADSRQYAINYYLLFPQQTLDTFASVLTDRWDRVAPVWTGTQYQYRPISSRITIPTGGVAPVDPALGFTVQLWMASLGNALIPASFDTTYADSARVWLAGTGATITPTLPTVTYADPFSGKQYTAVSYRQGILETGIGARMIARANELKNLPQDADRDVALKSYVELLDAQRSISEVYANPVW